MLHCEHFESTKNGSIWTFLTNFEVLISKNPDSMARKYGTCDAKVRRALPEKMWKMWKCELLTRFIFPLNSIKIKKENCHPKLFTKDLNNFKNNFTKWTAGWT